MFKTTRKTQQFPRLLQNYMNWGGGGGGERGNDRTYGHGSHLTAIANERHSEVDQC